MENKVCFGEEVDLVHWNAGLWDDLVMLDGKNLVPIEYYKENIDRICVILKMLYPNAKIIFATSTPVQYHSDLTHYYSKEGTRLLTNQVGKCIMEALEIKGKELDYDELFGEKDDFLGM